MLTTHIYTCTPTHMHAYAHTCAHTDTYTHAHTQCSHNTHMHVHMLSGTHAHSRNTHAYTHTHNAHTHARTCMHAHAHAHTMHTYMYTHVCSHGHTQRSHNKNMHAHMPAHTSPRILLCAVTMLQERPSREGADLGGFPRSPCKGLLHHPGPLAPDLRAWGSPWLKPGHPRQTAELSWLTAPAPPLPPPPAWVLLLPGLRQ